MFMLTVLFLLNFDIFPGRSTRNSQSHDWFIQIMTVERVKQIGQDPALRAGGRALIKINSLSDIKGHR